MKDTLADENTLLSLIPVLRGRLSERHVKQIVRDKNPKPRRFSDGGGLVLECRGAEGRSYLVRFQRDGREHVISLGSGWITSLAEARFGALKVQRQLARGLDPLAERKRQRAEQQAAVKSRKTFAEVAVEWHEAHRPSWSEKHAQDVLRSLEVHTAELSSMSITAIDRPAILRTLSPQWHTQPVSMSRVRQRVEAVIQFAVGKGYRPEGANPAAWENLSAVLPEPTSLTKVVNFPAMPFSQVPDFLAKVASRSGVVAAALQFTILSASRSGETLGAEWPEFDLKKALWTIPAARMKSKREHQVPLSPRCLAVLSKLPRRLRGTLVFPSDVRPGARLSNTAMRDLMLSLGIDPAEATVHGFRSSFRDWAAESGAVREVVEHSLAHRVYGKTEGAYARSTLLPARRTLMEAWATFCERGEPENVVMLRGT